jgi:hypothetical protein
MVWWLVTVGGYYRGLKGIIYDDEAYVDIAVEK